MRVEGGAFAFGTEAAFGSFVAQGFEGHFPEDGKIVGRSGVADLAVILAKDYIQNPVTAVFDTPVAADEGREAFGIGGDGAQVVMDLC